MEDADIVERIDELVEEVHKLESEHHAMGLSGAEREHLSELQVEIDRNWDLLRQRRALRHAGQDPEEAEERPSKVVEAYSQ